MTETPGAFPIEFPRDIRILDQAHWVHLDTLSWVGHIPFAFWIVGASEPRVIVELGTHYGNSYFAMAQSVQRGELATSMFAVDTWEGDDHAGRYGEEVFSEVSEYNSASFSGFSSLLRSTFDEALEYFSDGEVDLLHIDGYHTYEAVSHDFESWLPKLSSRGVVLLHDIRVLERDFGVHRLWAELTERYPTFAFGHGHGLGVVGIGAEAPDTVRRLLELDASSIDAAAVGRLFAVLGSRIALNAFESAAVTRAVEAAKAEKEAEIEDLLSEHADEIALLSARADRDVEAARIEIELADARAAGVYDERLSAIMKEGF